MKWIFVVYILANILNNKNNRNKAPYLMLSGNRPFRLQRVSTSCEMPISSKILELPLKSNETIDHQDATANKLDFLILSEKKKYT